MKAYKATQSSASKRLLYDPQDGTFIWREPSVRAGKIAGSIDTHGHRQITLDGEIILAHRLAWLMYYGEFPRSDVDHINGNRLDNRIDNLRLATRSQNCSNQKLSIRSTIGLKGVSRHGRRYRAQIQCEGKKRLLGVFTTAEEAHAAYTGAARVLHGKFARTK